MGKNASEAKWSEAVDGIQFRIWTDKLEYFEGEYIWLMVEFRNVGKTAKLIAVSPKQIQAAEQAPLYEFKSVKIGLNMDIQNPTIELASVYSNMLNIEPVLTELLPGQVYQEKTWLNSHFYCIKNDTTATAEGKRFFPKPGWYSIELVYAQPGSITRMKLDKREQALLCKASCWEGRLESNPIGFKIRPVDMQDKIDYYIKHGDWEQLEQVGNPAANSLIQLLQQQDSYIRNAVEVDPYIARVRGNIIEVLGNIKSRAAVRPLVGFISDKNDEIRETVARALGDIADKRASQPLIKFLQDKNGKIRIEAAVALGKIKDSETVPALLGRLKDKNLQEKVVWALGEIEDPRITKPLIDLFAKGKEQYEIGQILRRMKDPDSIEPLVDLLNNKKNETVILSILEDITGLSLELNKTVKETKKLKEIVEIQAALKKNPNNIALHFKLANLLKELEYWQAAGEELRKIIKLDPQNMDAMIQLGNMLVMDYEYIKAQKQFQKVLKTQSNNIAAHCGLGHLYFHREKHGEAESEYRQVLKIDPRNQEAHRMLGEILVELKCYKEAENELKIVIRQNPDDGSAHFNLGYSLSELEKLKEAEREYRLCLKIDPAQAAARNNLGQLFRRTNRPKEAEAQFRKTLTIAPNNFFAHSALANMFFYQDNYALAEQYFRKAINIHPEDFEMYRSLGVTLTREGKYKQAKKYLLMAIAKKPDSGQSHNSLAKVFHLQGNWNEAEKEYCAALNYDPNNAQLYFLNLSELLFASGKHREGCQYAKKAAKKTKDKTYQTLACFQEVAHLTALSDKAVGIKEKKLEQMISECPDIKTKWSFVEMKAALRNKPYAKKLLGIIRQMEQEDR